MLELIGRFHPILVHFPIGLFVTYLALQLFTKTSAKLNSSEFLKILLQIGCLSSILSLITGYFLSLEESNPESAVNTHKWTAIGTTLVFIVYYFIREKLNSNKALRSGVHILLFSGIIFTGHQGGSLTHGDDFLFASKIYSEENKLDQEFNVENISEAKVYDDLVQYTLNQKCVSCHGQDRQKGKLRLDDKAQISKGGKGGFVLNVSNPEESEILKRILLEDIDEHHMPPKEKTQLSEDEKTILSWWIKSGSSFEATVNQLKPDSSIRVALERFKLKNQEKSKSQEKGRNEVSPLDQQDIKSIQQAGWVLQTIATNDNHIRLIGYNLGESISTALEIIKKYPEHIVELKLSYQKLKDSDADKILVLENLEKLWIDHTPITDQFFTRFESLQQLNYLNISFTPTTSKTIEMVSKCKKLEKIYGYQTQISKEFKQTHFSKNPKLNIVLGDSMFSAITDSIFKIKAEE